jgi:hypothetical protein
VFKKVSFSELYGRIFLDSRICVNRVKVQCNIFTAEVSNLFRVFATLGNTKVTAGQHSTSVASGVNHGCIISN